MRFFRAKAWLVLVAQCALALQLLVSATHHHDHHAAEESGWRDGAGLRDACAPTAAKACNSDHAHDQTDDDADHCEICKGLALLGAALLPAPQIAAPLVAYFHPVTYDDRDHQTVGRPARIFHARDPPVA